MSYVHVFLAKILRINDLVPILSLEFVRGPNDRVLPVIVHDGI